MATGPVLVTGTVVVIEVPAVFTVNDATATPPNVTAVAPWKFWPVMTTEVPGTPLDGVNGEEPNLAGT